jgi:NAD(P)-dependent dehydrogenase (short-subunit alcohol dehydrogenase family)
MDGVSGRVAVVSGAGRGNGRAIAEGLSQVGATVAACDIDGETARATADAITAAGGTARAWALDVADRGACKRIAAEVEATLGAAGILINNAGIIRRGSADAPSSEEDWDTTLAVNATGTMNLTRAFLEQLRATRGRIVNLG